MTNNFKAKIKIRPELSAQGIRKRQNPMLKPAIETALSLNHFASKNPLIVDYGCGQLRNVDLFLDFSQRIILIDTPDQLNTPHDFFGKRQLIRDFIPTHWPNANLQIMPSPTFENSMISASIIAVVNVFDVVQPNIISIMTAAIKKNLDLNGILIVIVPRNDSWTLRLCTDKNIFDRGHYFYHPRGYTYYRNWFGDSLRRWLCKNGFSILKDLSCYRYVCLVLGHAK